MRDIASISRAATEDASGREVAQGWSVRSVATNHLAHLARLLPMVPGDALSRAIELLLEARAAGRRVFIMGNGGSSSTASHFVCDLVKTASVPGMQPFRAFSLSDNTPLLTAWANDYAYEHGFAEQIAALVEPGDVVIGISASGNSPNIVSGLSAAAARGAWTIGLVGFNGGTARDLVDIAIHIPSNDYGLVEDAHSAITHAITAAVRHAVQTEAAIANLTRHAAEARPTSVSAPPAFAAAAEGHGSRHVGQTMRAQGAGQASPLP